MVKERYRQSQHLFYEVGVCGDDVQNILQILSD